MNARDELADVFTGHVVGFGILPKRLMRGHAQEIATKILAAGYIKPRIIPPAHLHQYSDGRYPVEHKAGTIVQSADGSLWRFNDGDWDCMDFRTATLRGPATVLYEP